VGFGSFLIQSFILVSFGGRSPFLVRWEGAEGRAPTDFGVIEKCFKERRKGINRHEPLEGSY